MLSFQVIPPLYAARPPKIFQSRPIEYDTNVAVSNPTYAYDLDNNTCANFTRNTDGYFEVKNFTKRSGKISRVDFRMKYYADVNLTSEEEDAYRILYLVGSSPVELETWTTQLHSETWEVWESQPEPDDGVWDWNDIGNITFRVEIDNVEDADNAVFREYEAWVTVYIDYPFVSVDPPEILNATLGAGEQFTIDIIVDYVEKLSSYQFEMSFNPDVLHGVSVDNGPFLGSAGGDTILFPGKGFNNTEGTLSLFGVVLNPPDQKNPTGGSAQFGPLATVTYEVVGVGSSNLTLGSETRLLDPAMNTIISGDEFPTCIKHGYFSNEIYTLTIDSTPITGVSFSLDGVSKTTPFSEILPAGSYTVEMPSVWEAFGTEYTFVNWTDGPIDPTRVIGLTSSMSLTANYAVSAEYTLEIDSTPITGVSFSLDGVSKTTPFSEILPAGIHTIVMPAEWTVVETAYDFLAWTDGPTDPERTISLTNDMSLTAIYMVAAVKYTLEVNSTALDSTAIEGIDFNLDGAPETTPFSDRLEARRHVIQMPSNFTVDATQYWFVNWTDGSINPTRVINLTADMSLTAIYANLSVHNIDKDTYYETIQEAIDDAEADHTIEVYPKTYYEQLTIDKPLKLVGKDPYTTVIDGGGQSEIIYVTADNVTIRGFTVQKASWIGIYLDGVTGGIISGNTISDCSDGIGLYLSYNNTVNNNIVTIDGYPMWLDTSNNNTVYGNTITWGMWEGALTLWSSHNNTIVANTISNSSVAGIYLDSSNNNTIHHNNFLDNTEQASVSNSFDNIWDDGIGEGNYWSDYAGVDADSDGIGDEPYIIDANNNDTYPLMTPWPMVFEVVWEDGTYPVSIVSNSTVTNFRFSQLDMQISFNVTGPDATIGFCNITIPKELLDAPLDQWTVFVNGTPVTPIVTSNCTHSFVYFTYSHSSQLVQVIGTMVVDNIPPIADAGNPQTVNEDIEEAQFDGSGSWDDVDIKDHTWTFVDVTPKTLTGEKVNYTFSDPGIHVVTLNVTDLSDNWDTDTVVITVLDITPPIANASRTPQTVNEDTVVTLDGSASVDNVGVVGYTWTFEDVTPKTLTEERPTYTFNNPGDYTVTLNVTDAAGYWDTDTVVITVLDVTPPVANAGLDQTVKEDTLVTFDGSGSTDNVAIVDYTWTFVDVTLQTLTGVDPAYIFNTPGVYTVTLNISDAAGNWDTDTAVITVLDITRPLADAGPTQIVNEDTLVTFDGSASWDNDPAGITSYTWTFVDETPQTLTGVNPTYNFTSPGDYVVTLNVTDAAGNWGTDTVVIIVLDVTNPIAVADVSPDETVDEDTLVTFDGSASWDNIPESLDYIWVFTDAGALQILIGESVTYNFTTPGVYNVTLKVTDAAGNWDIDTVVITVLDITDPVADAGLDQTVDEDTLVTFDGSGSTDNVDIKSYTWTFTENGELRTLKGVGPNYIFATPGVYVVTLNVTDAAGRSAVDEVQITVRDVAAPVANAGADQTVDEDTVVTFDGSASWDNDPAGITSYTWTFVDETPQTLEGKVTTYTFATPGVYIVTLNVTDAVGRWDIDMVVITVVDVTDAVADAGSDQTVDAYTVVSFDASASTDNVGIESYVWTFMENDTLRTLTGANPNYIFVDSDNYTVTLKVTDAAGNWATDTVVITVLEAPIEGGTAFVPTWVVGAVVVAAIAIALGIGFFMRKRGKI